jgi:hypothetical protein
VRTVDAEGPQEAPELDALRRRLYGPDSTVDDVERYRRASGTHRVAPAAPPQALPSHRRPIGLLVAAIAVAVALVAVGFWLGGRRAATAAVPPATSAPTSVARQASVQRQLTVSAADRDALVRTLDTSTRSDPLSDYLYSHPDSRPDAVRTVQRAESEEHRGTGPARVRLEPSAIAADGGRVTVVLVLDRSGTADWRAAGTTLRGGSGPSAGTVGQTVRPVAGIPVTATFRYSMPAPTRLTVTVPAGVRWSVLVAFTD